MALTVQQIDANTFQVQSRGNRFTLVRRDSGWRVRVENAATRAWRSLGTRDFETLSQVSEHYKSLRGIDALIDSTTGPLTTPH